MFTHERKGRKPVSSEIRCCPVCGITLRFGDTDHHLEQEIEKLVRIPLSRPLSQRTPSSSALCVNDRHDLSLPSSSSWSEVGNRSGDNNTHRKQSRRRGRDWMKYDLIRSQRLFRARQKRRHDESFEDSTLERECPICDQLFPLNELQHHTPRCLRQAETEFEDEEVNIESDDDVGGGGVNAFEEYEWCGETRVRATTLLKAEGQLHAIGTTVTRGSEDELVDVCDVEEDAFGPLQYTEEDLISCHREANDRGVDTCHSGQSPDMGTRPEESVDKVKLSTFPCPDPMNSSSSVAQDHENRNHLTFDHSSGFKKHEGKTHATVIDDVISREASTNEDGEDSSFFRGRSRRSPESGGPASLKECRSDKESAVVEALLARMSELEEERQRDRVSCRVCHGDYDTPVASIICWHVHCETCWLQALAAKKLCPQCSAITATSDLRKIYL